MTTADSEQIGEIERIAGPVVQASNMRGSKLYDVARVGDESLSDTDKKVLEFANLFEQRFINQDYHEDRSIFESSDIGWDLLSTFDDPHRVLKRIPSEVIDKFHPEKRDKDSKFDSVEV